MNENRTVKALLRETQKINLNLNVQLYYPQHGCERRVPWAVAMCFANKNLLYRLCLDGKMEEGVAIGYMYRLQTMLWTLFL